jgi:hypothetical protein
MSNQSEAVHEIEGPTDWKRESVGLNGGDPSGQALMGKAPAGFAQHLQTRVDYNSPINQGSNVSRQPGRTRGELQHLPDAQRLNESTYDTDLTRMQDPT